MLGAHTVVRGVLLCLLAFIALAGWAVSSPIESSPDDDYHLASTWCSVTNMGGGCEYDGTNYLVPARLVQSNGCFALHPDISALCVMSIPADQKVAIEPSRINKTGLYPQGYYAVAGLLAGSDVIRSVYLMRLLNVLLAVLVGGVVLALAPVGLRRAGLLGILATCGPLGWFLLGSNNPSAWAVIALGFVGVAYLTHALSPSVRRSHGAFAATLVLLLMAASSRADAAIYTVIVVDAIWVGLIANRGLVWSRKLSATVLAALVTLVGLWSYKTTGQSGLAASNVYGGGVHGSSHVFQNLMNLPDIIFGSLGFWPLGWLDTTLPKGIPIIATMLVGGLVLYGLRTTPRRYVASWLMIVGALIAIPLYVYNVNGMVVGQLIQPRYLLPLLPICVALPLIRGNGEVAVKFSRAQEIAIGVVVFLVFVVSLHVNIRRYVTGTDSVSINLSRGAEWWSSTTISPNATWLIASTAAAGFLVLAGRNR